MNRRRAGEFDRRISIWGSWLEDDGTASVEAEPREVGKRWAKKVDISDGERLRANENAQELTTRWTVRADSLTRQIVGGFLIKHRGVTYAVAGTKEGRERDDVIEITTSARPDRAMEA